MVARPLLTRRLGALALSTVLAWPAAAAFPDRFAAHYRLVVYGAVVARGSWFLAPADDGRFSLEGQIRTAGVAKVLRDVSIVERSEWEYRGDSLRPYHYSYRRTGDIDPKEVIVAFDWTSGIADVTARNRTWRLPTPEGTLDDANYVLAMLLDLQTGKDELEYTVADGGLLKTYRLERIGQERLDTALGLLDTVKIRRIRKDSRRETTLWCAIDLQYLPVRVVHREKEGYVVTMTLESIEGIELPAIPPSPPRKAQSREP